MSHINLGVPVAALPATSGAEREALFSTEFAHVFQLLKPRVVLLVTFTGAVGMWLAPGVLHPLQSFSVILAIAAGAGAGGSFNMLFDQDIDALMPRTKGRPLPMGRVSPDDALALASSLSVLSVILMTIATNVWAASLLAFSIFYYSVIYTRWLKRKTDQNIVIGGAAGAFPPVIGWLAVTGSLDIIPLTLFAIIFLWTPAHFWSLALYRAAEFRSAGLPMLPITRGNISTVHYICMYTVLLVLACITYFVVANAGWIYMGAVGAGAVWFGSSVVRLALARDNSDRIQRARETFFRSNVYLFAIFTGMITDNLSWQWFVDLVGKTG